MDVAICIDLMDLPGDPRVTWMPGATSLKPNSLGKAKGFEVQHWCSQECQKKESTKRHCEARGLETSSMLANNRWLQIQKDVRNMSKSCCVLLKLSIEMSKEFPKVQRLQKMSSRRAGQVDPATAAAAGAADPKPGCKGPKPSPSNWLTFHDFPPIFMCLLAGIKNKNIQEVLRAWHLTWERFSLGIVLATCEHVCLEVCVCVWHSKPA